MKQNKKPKQTQKRETLNERVHRHISDKNSEITDDDIRSVRTELEIKSDTNRANSELNNENVAESKNKQTTDWDQLSGGYD